MFAIYLKVQFNWASRILSGDSGSGGGPGAWARKGRGDVCSVWERSHRPAKRKAFKRRTQGDSGSSEVTAPAFQRRGSEHLRKWASQRRGQGPDVKVEIFNGAGWETGPTRGHTGSGAGASEVHRAGWSDAQGTARIRAHSASKTTSRRLHLPFTGPWKPSQWEVLGGFNNHCWLLVGRELKMRKSGG